MTGVYVDTTDLRAKAIQVHDLKFTNPKQRPHIVAPDKVESTTTAVDNLDVNASALYRFQANGAQEGIRLAETLNSVAAAYDEVDAQSQAHIEGRGGSPQPVVPRTNQINDPTPPAPLEAQAPVAELKTSNVDDTEAKFGAGDGGDSLGRAGEAWVKTGTELRESATQMYEPIQNWEGDAAQEAYRKFREFADWLMELATAWDQLAGEAFEIAAAHKRNRPAHTEIYDRYMALAEIGDLEGMFLCQGDSDELRTAYAGEVQPKQIQPPEPPVSNVPTAPVTGNGTKPADKGTRPV